ncbi:MAG: DUF4292 domain-containing protein [Bacteroidia bacterium]|nr:DUF4292 domain-containing protein [Bacteroidia bacterium]
MKIYKLKSIANVALVISALCLLFVTPACSNRKGLPIKPKEGIKAVIDNRPALQLVKKQHEHELRYNWLSLKAAVETETNGENQNFDASIRIKKDSAIWISISPALGIEVMRVLITPDTVKYMNRLNNTYFVDAVCKINDLIHADFDFYMIQDLLVGNSFEYYDDDRLKTSIVDNNYLISSVRKGKLKRFAHTINTERDAVQSMWLEPLNFKLVKLRLDEFTSQRELTTVYSNFKAVEDSTQLMPHTINMNLKAQKTIVIRVNYSKVKLNQPQEFPFKIPAKYIRKQN